MGVEGLDFWELTLVLVRRWFVFLPVLALGLGATYLVSQRVEPSYTAEASMLVAGPSEELGEGNPYANSTTAAQVLDVVMESPEVFETVTSRTDAPDDIEYTVTRLSNSTILDIDSAAPTEETALQAARAVVSVIETRLAKAQDAIEVRPRGRSEVLIISQPREATPSTDGEKRVLLAGGGVSGLLALAAALTFEGLVRRRARATAT